MPRHRGDTGDAGSEQADRARLNDFLAGMQQDVVVSFTNPQLDEIKSVLRSRVWHGHRVNIRLSIPLPGGRSYLVLLTGPERRSLGRRIEARRRHPLATVRNIFAMTVLGVLGLVSLAALLYALLAAAVTAGRPG